MKLRHWIMATALALVVGASAVHAHSNATGIVKERMDAMKTIGKAAKTIVAMMRGEAEYDAAAIAEAAAVIKTHSGEALLHKFPEGSLDPPSEALPAIWIDWVGFKTQLEELRREAVLLEGVAANGPEGFGEEMAYVQDLDQPAGPVATRLVKSCKTCHDKFRKDD